MHWTHPVRCLERGGCSMEGAVSFGTLFWGSWEPGKAFEEERDMVSATEPGFPCPGPSPAFHSVPGEELAE